MRFGSKHNTSYISQCSNISTLCTFVLPSQCAGAIGTPPAVVEMPIPEGCFSPLLMETMSALFSINLLKMTRSSSGLFTFSAFSNSLRAMSSCLSFVVLSKDNPTFLKDSLPLSLLAHLMNFHFASASWKTTFNGLGLGSGSVDLLPSLVQFV